MKSPHFFLYDGQFDDDGPVIAIRRAQADAIAHCLKAMMVLSHKEAIKAISALAFELSGDRPQPQYREPTKAEDKELNYINTVLRSVMLRNEEILKGMEI